MKFGRDYLLILYFFTGFEKFSTLTNLEVLDLSLNGINNSKILDFISGILSLKSLNLGDNSLESLGNLTSKFTSMNTSLLKQFFAISGIP